MMIAEADAGLKARTSGKAQDALVAAKHALWATGDDLGDSKLVVAVALDVRH